MQLADINKYIEDVIRESLPDASAYPSHIVEAMNYAMTAGGKRIRPTLMYLTYMAFAESSIKDVRNNNYNALNSLEDLDIVVRPFLAAIEMIHTHSLIHDDLPALDNDSLRRGRPTVHVQFDESTAILAGDALLNNAYEVISEGLVSIQKEFKDSYFNAFNILSRKTGKNGMLGGQGLDVELSGSKITNEQRDYIYEKKTSALIEAPLMIGAVLAGADNEKVQKLEEAGRSIGFAFQVQDDILDAVGDAEKLGKEVHQDERNEKNTFVSEYGIDASRKFVKNESEKAVGIISEVVPENEYRGLLTDLIESMIMREK
ncbi:geranylgeranyl diphosphate synthase, type II [Lachnospiraceae bacterium]|nr:geranylgeranyl diphosphate synthase, type II [Lachnospiraceae bacterium]